MNGAREHPVTAVQDDLSAELYRDIFDATPEGVLVVDDAGRIVAANRLACAQLRWLPDGLVGQSIEVVIPERLRAVHQGHRAGFAEAPHMRPMGLDMSLKALRQDGTEFPVEISLSPLDFEGASYTIACLRDMSDKLQLKARAAIAIDAAENERRRVAHELHDDTAQRLAAILLRLRVATDSGPPDRQLLDAIREDIGEVAETVRLIARGMRPPELDDHGLGAAVRTWARALGESCETSFEVRDAPVDAVLSPQEALVFYRIAQEAMSNAANHAAAAVVTIVLETDRHSVRATIADDGSGFDVDRALGDARGLGLRGMMERAEMVGATLEIDSRPGAGSQVRVILQHPSLSREEPS